ncbi:MAG TPA: threonine dehydratase [Burkholderiales bacterium]|jgi:threonine dehydratase|nr:threonine dehydratase [Burkholderiales bacterium]
MSDFLPKLKQLEHAASIVYETMAPTSQYAWPLLKAQLGAEIWVKHENHTPIGAFKLRGGLTYFHDLARRKDRPTGVIGATRGNHGQSVGYAARHYGMSATIVVPHGNSVEKNAAMRALGVGLVEHGADFQAARERALWIAQQRGLHMVPSFHPLLVQGVASYSLELLRAVPDLDVAYVPIGLGSGICGMIAAREGLKLKTEIVGVVSELAPAYALSFEQKSAVEHPVSTRIADGMACRTPEPEALEILWHWMARVVRVTDDEVEEAMRLMYSATHNVAEGAGAAGLAAATKERDRLAGRKAAVILCGANVDRDVFARILGGK